MTRIDTDKRTRRRRPAPVCWLAALLLSLPAAAGVVDPTNHGPPFNGWGTSLAWWANVAGGWDDDEELEALMDAVFDVDGGLGLTIVRFNIGAGQNPDLPEGYMGAGREMPAYKDGPDQPYTFVADQAQRRVLLEGLQRGVQYVEANANSPPWWMTITQDSSGNPDGANLAPENYPAFGEYLATVTAWYRDTLGVEFSSVTPLNEPSASWWDGDGNQEGCTFPPGTQPAMLAELRAQLDAQGLHDIPVSGPEEWSSGLTRDSLSGYPTDVQQMLSHISTHTYGTRNRAGLNALSAALNKPLWMSEYGTGSDTEYDSAMQLARRIIGDFREMPRLQAWIIWQVMSTNHFNHTWACMLANFATGEPGFTYRPQYYAYANFSRFIRPGSRFIDPGEPDALAAFHPGLERLVIVALNDSPAPAAPRFDLGAFENLPATASVYRTSRQEDLVRLPDLEIREDGTVGLALFPESVTTYVIEGVRTPELPRTDWNADGRLNQRDVAAFLSDFDAGADQTDLNRDGGLDLFDLLEFLRAHDAAGPVEEVYAESFEGLETGDLGDVDLGNGADGGHYIADGRMYIQAFAGNGEEGGTTYRLQGVTLEPGVSYTVRLQAADFNQGWTTGGEYLVGLAATQPGLTSTPDLASATFSVPENDGPGPMDFQTHTFAVTVQETAEEPYILLRTDSASSGNQRIGFEAVSIDR